jgi:hypothetical protein
MESLLFGTARRYHYLREVLQRYCIRVGRGTGVGRPMLWKLKG